MSKMPTRAMREQTKELFFSELLSLLSSGLDFSNSFRLLIAGEENERNRQLLQQLYNRVVSGSALWEALAVSGRFSTLDCGVVRIGEETGRLDQSLGFLADYYRKKIAQRRLVASAVSYPAVILCVALVVVVFMLAVIVPMFEQVYNRMGSQLPALTRWIISASKSFPYYATAIGAAVLTGGAMLYSMRDSDRVRSATARLLLTIPIAGSILKKNQQAHICKLLYLLTSSGVPLLRSVQMLQGIIRFYPYQQSLKTIARGLERGEPLTSSLDNRLYDRKLSTLLRVGEETNRLPEMLQKQSEDLTRTLEYRLKQLGSMLEPLLIMFVGILVAIIMIAMYLPMFRLGGIMGTE